MTARPARALGGLNLDLAQLRRALLLGNLAVLLLMGLLSTVALWQSYAQFRQRALDTSQGQVQALAQALRVRTDRYDVALRAVVGIGPDPEALRTRLPRRRAVLPVIDQLHVTLSDGRLLPQPGQAAPLSTPQARQALVARVQAAPAGALVFSEPVLAADGQTWLLLLARRLDDDPDKALLATAVQGVMAHVELRTSTIQDLFAQAELGRDGAVSLRTQNLFLVARHVGQGPAQRPGGVGTNRVSEELLQVLRERPDSGLYFAATALDGIERANAYQRLDPYPLLLLVGLGTADVLQPWYRHAALVGALLAGSALLLAGLSWGLYRSLQRAAAAGAELHAREVALAREQALRQHSEQQVRALDELLRERQQLQDVLAHEVRQPLNNASAALQGAAAALAGTASAAAALPLTRAQTVLGQVIASIDNTLAVASLLVRDGPIARADVDLDMLVALAVGDLPAASRARVQVLRDTAVRTASLDLGLMRLALRNLLSNALAYGLPDTPVTLTLGDSDEPLGLTLDVENQTSAEQGVAPDLVPHLFERGSRGRRDRPGHGLGLYIVRRVMSLHDGQVQLLHNAGGRVVMRLLLLAAEAEAGEAAAAG